MKSDSRLTPSAGERNIGWFMTRLLPFLIPHGYVVLFVSVLVEHLGLPLPAVPALLAIGALAAARDVSPGLALVAG
jgi:membrane protein DedA with SNARE-associated domain